MVGRLRLRGERSGDNSRHPGPRQGPDLRTVGRGENLIGRQSETTSLQRRHRLAAARAAAAADGGVDHRGPRLGQRHVPQRREDPPHARLQQGDQIRVGSTLLVFGGAGPAASRGLDLDEDGRLVDSAIIATVPSNEDSVIVPTPEAGVQAIGNLRILYHLISTIGTIFNVDLLVNRVAGPGLRASCTPTAATCC